MFNLKKIEISSWPVHTTGLPGISVHGMGKGKERMVQGQVRKKTKQPGYITDESRFDPDRVEALSARTAGGSPACHRTGLDLSVRRLDSAFSG
jgi:hypothetical protein